MWWSASWVVTSTFHSGLTDIDKAYLLAAPISSLLELQSKSWVVELELELSAPRELTQSCGSDSAFRKGLLERISTVNTRHHVTVVSKFGDYRNSDGISSEGKSSDYFKKKISVSANSVSIFWALKYIESKLSD